MEVKIKKYDMPRMISTAHTHVFKSWGGSGNYETCDQVGLRKVTYMMKLMKNNKLHNPGEVKGHIQQNSFGWELKPFFFSFPALMWDRMLKEKF